MLIHLEHISQFAIIRSWKWVNLIYIRVAIWIKSRFHKVVIPISGNRYKHWTSKMLPMSCISNNFSQPFQVMAFLCGSDIGSSRAVITHRRRGESNQLELNLYALGYSPKKWKTLNPNLYCLKAIFWTDQLDGEGRPAVLMTSFQL